MHDLLFWVEILNFMMTYCEPSTCLSLLTKKNQIKLIQQTSSKKSAEMYKIILYKANTLILWVRQVLFFYQSMGESAANTPNNCTVSFFPAYYIEVCINYQLPWIFQSAMSWPQSMKVFRQPLHDFNNETDYQFLLSLPNNNL